MTMYTEGSRFEDELCLGKDDFEEIDADIVNQPEYDSLRKAAHVMFYAPTNNPVLKCYNPRAAVHMKVRFDGHLGFPGGCLDTGETPEDAVNREFVEESGMTGRVLTVTAEDLCAVHRSPSKKLISFFYVKKISLLQLARLEKSYISHEEWGDEVLGTVRVPLYMMSDGFRGLPAFLTSPFVGNSKQQLIMGLLRHAIVTESEMKAALDAKPAFDSVEAFACESSLSFGSSMKWRRSTS